MSLNLTISLDRPAYPPGPNQAIHALLDFAALGVTGRLPLDLRLVLDNSGSMGSPAGHGKETKSELLCRAVARMLDQVNVGDHLTLVSFEHAATVLFEDTVRGPADVARAKKTLKALTGGGGTQISAGLARALQDPPLPDAVARVVLVTDGETMGDEAECERLAFTMRGQATWLVYGIGVEYNDAFLDGLARANDGKFVHLGDMQSAADAFDREVAVMGEVALTNLVVSVEPAPGVGVARADQIVPQVLNVPVHDPAYLAVSLGDLDRVRGQKLLVQLDATGLQVGRRVLGRVRASFHVPVRKLLNQQLEWEVAIDVSTDAAGLPGDAEVLRTAQLAGAARLCTLGLAEAAGGSAEASARTLASAAGLYDGLGLGDLGDQVRTLTSGLATRVGLDEDARRTLTTMARASGTDLP